MAKQKVPEKYRLGIKARRRLHLSDAHIQMARGLGLNAKKFGGLANTRREPWKLPLTKRPKGRSRLEWCWHTRAAASACGGKPHFPCLVLEGGFDESGKFVHIPLGDIQRMSEYFRRVTIGLFLKQEPISARIATSLLDWRHSGFSVDAAVRIPAFSDQAREALSQYIARPPLPLKWKRQQQADQDVQT